MSAIATPHVDDPMASGLELLVGVVADEVTGRRLQEILEHAEVTIVGSAERPRALAAICPDRHPHVVVLVWDDAAAPAAMRALASALPETRIVAVLRNPTRGQIRAALRVGADGIVVESQLPLTLPPVVRAVGLGQTSVPREVRGELDDESLSTREREVLTHVADGLTNAEIAVRLCLSESTVKSHLASAFSKLGVHSRDEAAGLLRRRRDHADSAPSSSAGRDARVVKGGNAA